MPTPSRGDIYHIEIADGEALGRELKGSHWWVVISPTQLNQALELFKAVPLSSLNNSVTGRPKDDGDFRNFRIRILTSSKTKDPGRTDKVFDDVSIALTEQSRTFSIRRTDGQPRSGTVDEKALGAIESGLLFVFGAGIHRQSMEPAVTAPDATKPIMTREPSKPLPGKPFQRHNK